MWPTWAFHWFNFDLRQRSRKTSAWQLQRGIALGSLSDGHTPATLNIQQHLLFMLKLSSFVAQCNLVIKKRSMLEMFHYLSRWSNTSSIFNMSLIKIGLQAQNPHKGDKNEFCKWVRMMKNKFLFIIYILKFQTCQVCDPQIYKCIFLHVFHLFITIISMLSITLPYAS